MAKLTKAQRDLLHVIRLASANVADTYRPAKALVEMGFADWQEGRYGSMRLFITDAGRSVPQLEERW